MQRDPASPIDLSRYSYDALIFDCDGTLVNTAPWHFEAFRLALQTQGGTLERSWYNDRLSLARFDLLTEFAKQTEVAVDVDAAVIASELNFLKLTDQIEVIPEIALIVQDHWRKTPMAVASSGQRLSVDASLKSVGLLEKFDAIVTANDVQEHKPAPAAYLKAAEMLGVDSARCLVFEDTDAGLESAHRAGSAAIDVREFASLYQGSLSHS